MALLTFNHGPTVVGFRVFLQHHTAASITFRVFFFFSVMNLPSEASLSWFDGTGLGGTKGTLGEFEQPCFCSVFVNQVLSETVLYGTA